jgi:hypothetical protein
LPNNQEHCEDSLRRYGKTFSELHKWMDEPSAILGSGHRIYRHDPLVTPAEARRLFGEDADHACLDHIRLDELESRQKEEGVTPLPYKSDWLERILLAIPSGAFFIIFVYLINLVMGDPIGLWWNQNWFKVIGATVFMIVWVLITYAFGNKNKILKVAILYLGFAITVFYLFNVLSGDFIGLWWSLNWDRIVGFSVFMVLIGILCIYGWRKIKKKENTIGKQTIDIRIFLKRDRQTSTTARFNLRTQGTATFSFSYSWRKTVLLYAFLF